MNEHIRRVHGGSVITDEDFRKLETCQAWKPFGKSSFRAIPQAESSLEVEVDFRMESMLESKVGLLKSCIVLYEGEEQRIGSNCLRYFHSHKERNPYFDEVVTFLKKGTALCRRAGSEHCRQQAVRDADGATSESCFRPIQMDALLKYAGIVAHMIHFATKCPWDHQIFNLTDVPSILRSIFFEPRLSIQQNYMTRYVQ